MDPYEFNKMVNAFPKVTKQIGEMADGSPITVQVPSMFAEAPDAGAVLSVQYPFAPATFKGGEQ